MNKKLLLLLWSACTLSSIAHASPEQARSYGQLLARHFCEGAPSIVGTGTEPLVVICFPPAISSHAERNICQFAMKELVLRQPDCAQYHATRLPVRTPHHLMVRDFYQRLEKNCQQGTKSRQCFKIRLYSPASRLACSTSLPC